MTISRICATDCCLTLHYRPVYSRARGLARTRRLDTETNHAALQPARQRPARAAVARNTDAHPDRMGLLSGRSTLIRVGLSGTDQDRRPCAGLSRPRPIHVGADKPSSRCTRLAL